MRYSTLNICRWGFRSADAGRLAAWAHRVVLSKAAVETVQRALLNATVEGVEVPEVDVMREHKLTGSVPPPPLFPLLDQPILVVMAARPAIPASLPDAAVPAKLPKTASSVPLFGLLGLLSLAAS